ncbi:MAG: hypothetical protein HZA51_11835 [Planctomycetes bacterium]|nr:hypothetical protein [Planctomycetota bacterium]
MHSALLLCFLIITQISEPACVDQSALPDPITLRAQRERQTMPYRPGTGRTAPSRHVQFGPHVSIQVNVDANGNNILDDAANEPSIAVDPTNPYRMAIGWRQFDSVYSNFRQAGYGYTADAGRNWIFPGTLQPGVFRSDPVLAASPSGEFYYNSLRVSPFRCDVFRSANGGQSWPNFAGAYGGDKAWMGTDKTSGVGRGNIYAAWSPGSGCCSYRSFTRSTDGGQTWLDPIDVPLRPPFGTISVGPDGELYVSGGNPNGNTDETSFVVVRSDNAQDPAVVPSFQLFNYVSLDGLLPTFIDPNPDGLLGQAWIATDHSSGRNRGNVYLLCSVIYFHSGWFVDVRFSRSTDKGVSWSLPNRVNDDVADSRIVHWFATMSVAPNGRIDIIWNDTRHSPSNRFISELYYSSSSDGGLTWSPNEQLSPAWDSSVGWPNQSKIGDYYHMVSDDLGANLAYAATFNGEQDVWFLRIGDYPCLGLITQQPASPSVCQGSTVSLHASADPRGSTVTYQWRKNGTPLADSDAILGAQSPTLVFLHAQPAETGDYDCYVKLPDCGAEISHTATLTVFPTNTADGNLDGLTDARDIAPFVDSLVNFAPVSAASCAYDLTGEGIVNTDDIAPFVARLLSE